MSLKFVDALGLSRSFVPCIVAFDNVDGAEFGIVAFDRRSTMCREMIKQSDRWILTQ